MVTPCQKCGNVLFVPPVTPIASFQRLHCKCGHSQLVIGIGSTNDPTRVSQRRLFPWLPPFP